MYLKVLCHTVISFLLLKNVEGIVGDAAREAFEGQFPYHVSLQWYGNHQCGGTIISEWFIISAAHCFISPKNGKIKWTREYKVWPGVTNLNHSIHDQDYYWKKLHKIDKLYIPLEAFTHLGSFFKGDIALIKLNRPLNLVGNSNLKALDLPGKYTYENKTAIVAGFGWNYWTGKFRYNYETNAMEEIGKSYNKLFYAKAKVWKSENHRCQEKDIICAHVFPNNLDKPSGVCNSDSGSSLVYYNEVIGILSKSPYHCNESVHPATYTSVSFYKDFIEKSMNDSPDSKIVSIEYSKLSFTSRLKGNQVIYHDEEI